MFPLSSQALSLYRRTAWSALLAAALLALSQVVQAHPHGWVDYRVEVRFDDQGRVVALREVWRMDPFYSLTLIEEMEAAGTDEDGRLKLDQDITETLAAGRYLTHLYAGDVDAGPELGQGEVDEVHVEREGSRILVSFELPLAEPLRPTEQRPLRYQIFDSSYYIEFLHDPDDVAISLIDAPEGCESRVIPADPDPSLVAQAAMIDVDGQAPEGLGRFFTDTGEILCSAD
ncbi:DUF1007 family protein [Halotalea alkalilenta]|uniref:DUF1007 family protein n=1 Tax=Halotalea alkalilenta TaxID=376489 RepID=UPI001CBEC6B6|nr:DUF1007 family protein [Halotalea alkalilenta]